jgi:predicted KAP-like P-loop ATPase
MHLFPREMEITPTEGFTRERDIFGRKSFADRLTKVVQTVESPSVLLLDAPWGSGKTTFVKMWQGELNKAGVQSIYFDAFANDYQEDAFLAVAGQIIGEASKLAPPGATAIRTFKSKALTTAKVLGRAGLRIGIHALTAGPC